MVYKRKFVMKIIIVILLITSSWQTFAQKSEYPTPPRTNKLLFYIQRNHNANTIIYDANFDSNGNLLENEPIKVYWIRYEEHGQKMELRKIEKWYAYGVSCEKEKENTFSVKLAADKNKNFKLVQTEKFKAYISTKINGENSILKHMYIFAEETEFWPKVKYIEFFGKSIPDAKPNYQKIFIEQDGI